MFIIYDVPNKGYKKGSGNPGKAKGTIICANLSDENSAEELDFEVSISTSNPGDDEMKEYLRKEGVKHLRKRFEVYVNELKHGKCFNIDYYGSCYLP